MHVDMRLTKHHGLGNDFLVLLDHDGSTPLGADLARRLCHRTEGIGADGLIRATRPARAGAEIAFELRNADGSVAEVSGNGLRCLVQAAVMAGWLEPGSPATITTVAGDRVASVEVPGHPTMTIAVDMGPVVGGEAQPGSLQGSAEEDRGLDVGPLQGPAEEPRREDPGAGID